MYTFCPLIHIRFSQEISHEISCEMLQQDRVWPFFHRTRYILFWFIDLNLLGTPTSIFKVLLNNKVRKFTWAEKTASESRNCAYFNLCYIFRHWRCVTNEWADFLLQYARKYGQIVQYKRNKYGKQLNDIRVTTSNQRFQEKWMLTGFIRLIKCVGQPQSICYCIYIDEIYLY